MENVIVNHVMASACETVAQLRLQCVVEGGPPVLRLIVGIKARVLGFDLFETLLHRKPFDDFHNSLEQHFLNDFHYIFLDVMGAAATASKATMVIPRIFPEYCNNLCTVATCLRISCRIGRRFDRYV